MSKIPGKARPVLATPYEDRLPAYPLNPHQEEEPPSHTPAYLRMQQDVEVTPVEPKPVKRSRLVYPEQIY
jgi:hypothetical protein